MDEKEILRNTIIDVIKTIFDPEIPVSIWELGLIYGIDIFEDHKVHIKMTLTAPGCFAAQELPVEVEQRVLSIAEIEECIVEIVWEPAWNISMMSEAAQLELGFM